MNDVRAEFPITAEVERIGRAIAEAGGRPVLVGGWVRDCLLGHPHSKDFDIEVFRLSTKELQAVLAQFGPLHTVGRHFGVLKLSTRAAEYDISVPRRESKIGKGHREFDVVADPTMSFDEAAARRDFTINSIGYAFLERETLDPFQGRRDLALGVLRHTGPAFGEDPLRVLRAMQFAGRFGMAVAEETIGICREQDLSELPHERIWEEFRKLLLHSARPSLGLRYAGPLGVLPYFPELEALARMSEPVAGGERFDAWQRTLAVVDRAALHRKEILAPAPEPLQGHGKSAAERHAMVLMLAALTHLLGAPEIPESAPRPEVLAPAAHAPLVRLMERLTRERDMTAEVWALVRDLPAPDALYERAARGETGAVDAEVRRLALRVAIPDLLRLARARYEAEQGVTGHEPNEVFHPGGMWLDARSRTLGVHDRPPAPLLKGRHLLELGLRPGPHMGPLLDAAFERQLDGDIASLDDALRWVEGEIRARQGA